MTGTYRPHLRASLGWTWLLAYGLLVILVGLAALFNPMATGIVTGIMLAIGLLIYSLIAVASSLWFFSGGPRWSELLLGVVALLAAIMIFDQPLSGAVSVIWVIGAWLLASGIFHITSAIRLPAHRGWRLFSGVVDSLLGVFLLFAAPTSSLIALSFLVGASFVSRGLLLVSASLAIRRL